MTTWNDVLKRKLTQSDWTLIIANLFPVYGVWFHQWDAKEVFLVYCLETIIIGFYALLKMGITGSIKKKDDWHNQGTVTKQPALLFMLFFLVHYGLFVSIQMGMFFAVSGIADQSGISFFNFFYKWPQLVNGEILVMLSVFIVSYTFRNVNEYIFSGAYRTASMSYLMFQPYGRIFIQQVTVITGSIFLSFGAGKIFILVFSLVKIFFDVFVDFNLILKKAAAGELKS
ncbi:MAG TPA: DUF6498-containing protein [Chitinophagaceae bacterium]|nr:DUF6498-containing protein [Chitinophagaceae bacterium]